jgi:hypothetical protein
MLVLTTLAGGGEGFAGNQLASQATAATTDVVDTRVPLSPDSLISRDD